LFTSKRKESIMLIIPTQLNGEPLVDHIDGYYCPVFFWA
jgi:hypothetical protein